MILARGQSRGQAMHRDAQPTLQQVGTPVSRGLFTRIERDPLVSTSTNGLAIDRGNHPPSPVAGPPTLCLTAG